jgi:hypothetical protein
MFSWGLVVFSKFYSLFLRPIAHDHLMAKSLHLYEMCLHDIQ